MINTSTGILLSTSYSIAISISIIGLVILLIELVRKEGLLSGFFGGDEFRCDESLGVIILGVMSVIVGFVLLTLFIQRLLF